ncbi:MAG: hypothetical protein GC134_02885 [Proteobacteria bacterium]|nr:hypothetical protein [Pseudomonadota bacterium]
MRRTLTACAVSVLALSGCKSPFERGPRFQSLGFACTEYKSAVAIDTAEGNNNGMAIQALLRQGCLMVNVGTSISPAAKSGEYIQFATTPRALGIHMVPGMEKIDKLTLWTHNKNLAGMEKYQTKPRG